MIARKKENNLLAQTRMGEIKLPILDNTYVDVISTDSPQLRQKLVMSKGD